MLKDLIDLFFPKFCPSCGRIISRDEEICFRCKLEIPPMNMEQNLHGKWYFDKLFYFGLYEGKIKEMIHYYKYRQYISLSKYFVLFFDEMFDFFPPLENSVITTVPITFNSFKIKGFDHMKKIGKMLAEKRNIEFFDLIEVVRQKKQQVNSSFEERRSIVNGKYGVKLENLYKTSGQIVILDDVFTTGSTVNECARVLKGAGAKSVYVYTIAKTPSHKNLGEKHNDK